MNNQPDWENIFDEKFVMDMVGQDNVQCLVDKNFTGRPITAAEVKSFIRSLLLSERNRLLEEVKLESKPSEQEHELWETCSTCNRNDGYNQAIKDLEELKGKLKG